MWSASPIPYLRPPAEDPETVTGARELCELYQRLGCKPTWTCAPYQLPGGPRFGDHIAAGESNAVSYYNSVVGARTNKYGDYLDVACALIGMAPFAGLHTDRGPQGAAAISTAIASMPDAWKRPDIFYHLLGHHCGPHRRAAAFRSSRVSRRTPRRTICKRLECGGRGLGRR